ncbi:MAG: succinylglutamate desuccinylase/aspartoacylase family protein [Saprospiraceae bacterium]|nr:succinylglutamate desuccinylase/aspartoacylase family protein [Saprospiraceae bacterium]
MDPFNIQGQEFGPGSYGVVRINAGRLPSGNRISISAYIFRSRQPGPVALFLGGMHGDEINGVEILRRAITEGMFSNLDAGSVICIPVLNIFGFINFSRDVPDGKDVNRSFPGIMTGSLASRVARLITKKILSMVDFGIDFHTGGRDHWNMPQLRYTSRFEESFQLAMESGFPLLVQKPVISKSLRKVARDLKIPILIFEGGEALRLDHLVIDKGLELIKNLLIKKGMKTGKLGSALPPLIFKKTMWERSPDGGIVSFTRKAGEFVRKDELLAIINDPFGQKETRLYATRSGYLLSHNNAPVVHQGDGLFHIGYDSNV